MCSPRVAAVRCLIIGLASTVAVSIAVAREPDQSEAAQATRHAAAQREVTQGALRIIEEDGSIVECPLKHTDVKADVSGFIARVNITQTFQNPTQDAIEAVYVFPLPHKAAVDSMTMVIGQRKVVGLIKRRDEARRIYEQALMQGQTAALLEQERPNIFTQSVGNIAPNQEIKIQISYVDVLKYDMGEYEFHFPMVVGPRFIPGAPVSSPNPTPQELQGNVSSPVPDTTRVPDAERITPPVLRPEVRNGHDISLTLSLDAGVPVQNLSVANHEARIERDSDRRATVKLSPADSLPNKDFVVRYAVVGEKPEMAVLAHTGNYSNDASKLGNGYFMLMIQPKEDERLKENPPREMVFLVDVSGSMRGAKTDKTRETMQHMLGFCRKQDTVQVVTFAGLAQKLFEQPVPVDEASIEKALDFTSNLRGSGGTHMLQGVKLAIDEPIDSQRVRIIVMLTDGFIGNESEIIGHVGRHCGDQIRFWTIGIGQSPNMFLIDGVAKQGGGMGKRLGLNDEAESLSREVMTRIQRAQLAKVKIDWGDMQVLETYPARIPELWAGRPVVLFGRYRDGGRHEISVCGMIEGQPARWPLTVELPEAEARHDVLAKVWARQRVEELMQQTYYAGSPAVEEEVTALALDYRLMSQYTSFVAVDEQDADKLLPPALPPRRMLVPVPLPEGAEWQGFFGERDIDDLAEAAPVVRFEARDFVQQQGGQQLAKGRGFRGGLAGGGWAFRSEGLAAVNRAATPMYFNNFGRPAAAASTSESLRTALGTTTSPSPVTARLVVPSRNEGLSRELFDAYRGSGEGEAKSSQMNVNLAALAVRPQAEQFSTLAQTALKSAQEFLENADLTAARSSFTRACFLDRAAVNFQYSSGQLAGESLAALEEIHRQQVVSWTDRLPELGKRVTIVLRDCSIDEALQQVARTAGVPISLVPGSVDDAARLTEDVVWLSYLDLRGATVAQSLDWILRPARLSWRLDDDKIVVASDRRLTGRSAWVYDVSYLVFPIDEEMQELKGTDQVVAAAKKTADDFMRIFRRELQIDDQLSVYWFAPGQLLVFGTVDSHNSSATLLANLSDPSPRTPLTGEAGKLQLVTAKRSKQRKDLATEMSSARRLVRVARAHSSFGCQLLAGAADGRLDDEALTELKIAWRDTATKTLLAGKGRAQAMRSLWMVTEASKALPDEQELTALARTAREQSKAYVADTVASLEKNSEDAEARAALLYVTLALRDDAGLRASHQQLLTKTSSDKTLEPAHFLAQSLFAPREQIDRTALAKLLTQGVSGDDMVLLTAIACRRAGGETWQTFRAEARDLLGSQPLSGQTLVVIHRLSQDRLPIARE